MRHANSIDQINIDSISNIIATIDKSNLILITSLYSGFLFLFFALKNSLFFL